MLGRIFGTGTSAGQVVVATLNARAQPLDRGDIYEDPLDMRLRERRIGKVLGAGTMMQPTGEIDHCDIDIELVDLAETTLAQLAAMVNDLGAPKGSRLVVGEPRREIAVGAQEGLGLYLNGTDLPDEVYERCDVNELINCLERTLGTAGNYVSHWQGPRETALYLYGRSFDTMRTTIAPVIEAYPLCEKARVTQIA